MGCCCSILWCCIDNKVDETWFDQYKAEKFNGHTLQVLSKESMDEMVRLYTHAFGGTPETEPEHATRWCLGKKYDGEWPSTNEDVRNFMEWSTELSIHMAFRYGIVVGVKDSDGNVMAMAIMYPRGHSADWSLCPLMGILCCDMNCTKPPGMDKELFPGASERMGVLDKVIDKKIWKDAVYLNILAVDPKHQGKGLGKALLRFVSEVATREKTFAYLEADGPKNPSIYKKFGYVNDKVVTAVDPTGEMSPLDLHLMKSDNPPNLSCFGDI